MRAELLPDNMQKKFFSNLLLIILLNLLVKPYAIFAIDATVQNRVGAENYGMYFSLLNLSFLFNILMDLGINNFTTKHVAQYPKVISSYVGKLFSFRLILFAIYALVTITIGVAIGHDSEELYLLLILIFNQWLVTFIAYFRSHFGGLHLFKTDAFISVLDRILLIFICGFVLFTNVTGKHFEIEWFIWMQTVCYLITLITAFILLTRKIGIPKFTFHWAFSIAILRKSYPYALLILLMMIYTRTDSVMIERIHPNGKYEAGVYAQGFRLLDALFMFGMIFANMLLPIFSRMFKQNKTDIPAILVSSRNLLVGGSILIAALCFFNPDFILGLIYKNDVSASTQSFQWLMLSFIGMCLSLIYGTLLTAKGDMRFLNQLSIVGIVVNIAFNALLIPEYGAAGSAFATLVTQGFTALIQLFYAHSKLEIPFRFKQTLRFAGFTSIFLVFYFFIPQNEYSIYLQLAAGTIGLFVFKLIDVKELKKQFSTEM